ncbi:MAG: hypothetical protein ABJF50_25065 [Paracoccaceae bacterium]
MNKFVKGLFAAFALSVSVCGSAVSANAAVLYDSSVDKYIGGIGVGVSNPGDVIGRSDRYDTTRAVVEKNNNDLSVKIYSTYMDNPGSDGTSLGALFIGEATDPLKGLLAGGPAGTTSDTYVNNPKFQYAVNFDDTPPTGTDLVLSGDATLYKINNAIADVELSDASGGHRGDQAVRPTSSAAPVAGSPSTWNLEANNADEASNYLEFVIQDYFINTNINANVRTTDFVFAWAMSCANDVWLDIVTIPGGANPVPLPGGLILLLSGLLGVGWLGRARAKLA